MLRIPKTHLHPMMSKVTNKAPNILPAILCRCLPRIFKTLSHILQQLPLLRITLLELSLGHGKERRIETGQVFVQEVAVRRLDGVAPVEGGVEAGDVVPAGWNGHPGIAAVDEEIPE
jgi:hypothetical protein